MSIEHEDAYVRRCKAHHRAPTNAGCAAVRRFGKRDGPCGLPAGHLSHSDVLRKWFGEFGNRWHEYVEAKR